MISPTILKKWVDRRRNPVQSVAHTLLCPTKISNVFSTFITTHFSTLYNGQSEPAHQGLFGYYIILYYSNFG